MWTINAKKVTALLTATVMVFGLSGCSVKELLKSEESGSGSISVVDDSMYLNLGALTATDELVQETYTTVTRGSIVTNISDLRASAYFPNVEFTNFPESSGVIRFVDICVESGQYVKAGDVVAHIKVEYDKSPLEEKELNLQRRKERFAETIASNEKSLKEYLEDIEEAYEESYERNYEYDDYTHDINLIYYDQKVRAWEKQKKAEEEAIAEAEKELKEYKSQLTVTEVKAAKDGYIRYVNNYLKEGDIVTNWDTLIIVTLSDKVFVSVENATQKLVYGNELKLTISGNKEVNARVVSPSYMSSYSSMQTKNVILEVDCTFEDVMNAWRGSLTLNGVTNRLDDVLLVERTAVTAVDGVDYVTVIREDGTRVKRAFTPGGGDDKYYWVYEGLEEGTVLLCN